MDYAIKRIIEGRSFSEIVAQVRTALLDQGFGIPTEMDTQAIFRNKLGRETPARIILGACLPQVAIEALAQESDLAVLLPCNVVVRELDGAVEVATVAPEVLFSLSKGQDLSHARLIQSKLQAVLASL